MFQSLSSHSLPVSTYSVEDGVNIAAVDSHPTRTNGFLTGCLINVLKDFARPTVEDLPK